MSILRRLLDDNVSVAESRLDEMSCSSGDLFDEEQVAIRHAVARRRHEFIAGRVLARAAMVGLGAQPQCVPAGPDRSPAWPPGIVGSITHSVSWCAVAVARADEVGSIGIDIEEAGAVGPELWPTVCTAAELEWLATLPEQDRAGAATILFSAKEAVFKAQYPLTGRMLDHQQVGIRVAADRRHFVAEVAKGPKIGGVANGKLEGRLRVSNGMVATSAVIPIADDGDGSCGKTDINRQ
jgi:4'-phosphopantetheinyl transferase EntD